MLYDELHGDELLHGELLDGLLLDDELPDGLPGDVPVDDGHVGTGDGGCGGLLHSGGAQHEVGQQLQASTFPQNSAEMLTAI